MVQLVNRRNFIVVTTLGVGGGILGSSGEALAASPLLTLLGRFAFAVGSTVVAELITDFLKSSSDSPERSSLNAMKNKMAAGGFPNMVDSRVFRGDGKNIYFLGRDNAKTKNGCVAFHAGREICMLEGPSLLGLGAVTEELFEKFKVKHGESEAQKRFKGAMFPRESLSQAEGNFENGYNRPDRYRTDDGTVEMNYKATGGEKGELRLKIVEAKSGEAWERKYGVDFKNA